MPPKILFLTPILLTTLVQAQPNPKPITGTLPAILTEASGITPLTGLPNDQFLYIGDKKLEIFQITQGTSSFNHAAFAGRVTDLHDDLKPDLDVNDMEDVAWDSKKQVAYVLVSGSMNSKSEPNPKRQKLVRLTYHPQTGKFSGDEVDHFQTLIASVAPALKNSIPVDAAIGGPHGTFNMEGIALAPNGDLLFGFRSPTSSSGDAIVVTLKNPGKIFGSHAEAPHFAPLLQTLKLGGQGIRGMFYDSQLKGCWITSGASANGKAVTREPWKLWFWDLKKAPQEKAVPKNTLKNAEGVCRMNFNGKPGLLFIEDMGKDKDDNPNPCHYALIALPK